MRVRQFCEQHKRRAVQGKDPKCGRSQKELPARQWRELRLQGRGRLRRSPRCRVGGGASVEIDKGAFRERVCVAQS